jgi:Spy/CpxP family protein refolding chaperone
MKRTLILAVAAVLLVAAGVAWSEGPVRHRIAGPGHHGMVHGGGFFGEGLNLTDEQKAEARKIHEEVFAKAKPIMEQLHEQWKAIHEMLDAGNAVAAEVGERMIAAHATRQQLKALHEDAETRFAALLNAEQLAKFKERQDEREEHVHRFLMMHHGMEH